MTDRNSSALGWIAALVSPRDVAPHPNFRSEEEPTAYGTLALLASARFQDFARAREDERFLAVLASDEVDEILSAAVEAMQVGSVESGAQRLTVLSDHSSDPGVRVAAAVLAATALAESDHHSEADEVLVRALRSLRESDLIAGPALIAAATLLLARALNAWDRGRGIWRLAEEALALLAQLDPSTLPQFSVSRVRNESTQVAKVVVDALSEAARGHVVQGSSDWSDRLEDVKQERSRATARRWGQLADALHKEVGASFRAQVSANPPMTFGSAQGADRQLTEALLSSEYVGSLSAHHYRATLGRLRLVNGTNSSATWEVREALRLLRHAGADLRLAIGVPIRRESRATRRNAGRGNPGRRSSIVSCSVHRGRRECRRVRVATPRSHDSYSRSGSSA